MNECLCVCEQRLQLVIHNQFDVFDARFVLIFCCRRWCCHFNILIMYKYFVLLKLRICAESIFSISIDRFNREFYWSSSMIKSWQLTWDCSTRHFLLKVDRKKKIENKKAKRPQLCFLCLENELKLKTKF